MTTADIDLVDRYVAVWNEPDPEIRHKLLPEIWADGGVHRLDPPQEMRERATEIGFPAAELTARGYEQLEKRVTRANTEFVAPGTYRFRRRDDVSRIGDCVKFHWEMVSVGEGEVAAVGLEILLVDTDGRIRTDYQFIEQ